MNIYVGNLAPSTTEDALRDLFTPFGAVASARIIKDRFSGEPRGFGFVEMPSTSEANEAIAQLNGSDFDGQRLRVNEARPPEQNKPRRNFDRSGGGGFGGGNGGGFGSRNRY